ncbi:MAG TPA: hypothetical protein VLR91_06885, partial [Thermodesulfobacteriota bacterium]|nr:hypothetical protein [Thermodesulfobacteriota bacterium]
TYLHRTGWQGFWRNYFIIQNLTGRGSHRYYLTDIFIGKALRNKRGLVSLEIDNILDRHFYYMREPVALDIIFPSRRILFKLALFV